MSNPDQLILDNLGLVHILARKYRRFLSVMSYDDIIGYGNLGLVLAAHKYDDSREVKFTTFASWWIYGQIQYGATKFGYVKHHRSGQATWYSMSSLNTPMSDESDTEFIDTLEGDMNDDVMELIQSQEIFDICAKKLTMREAQIIDLIYKHNYKQIDAASKLGVSRQCVNQKRIYAEEKIRKVLNSDWEEEPSRSRNIEEIREKGVDNIVLEKLTDKELRVFKYIFHEGINQWETSVRLNLSQSRVSKICRSIREKAEQMMLN